MSEQRIRELLIREVEGFDSVLDVGAGCGKFINPLIVSRKEAIEAQRNYAPGLNVDAVYIGTAQDWLPKIRDEHVDVVIALDFIEHLEKPEAIAVIKEMQRVARERVVIFTPNGFHPQNKEMPNADRYSDDEWRWQTHRSGWTVKDLEELDFHAESFDFDYGKGEGMSSGIWAVWSR